MTHPNWTFMIFFRVLGGALLLAFLAGLFLLMRPPVRLSVPAVLPIGSAFDDNPQIPVQEFKSKFETGVRLMEQHETSAVRYRKVERWVGWASFGLTALITLFAGFAGRVLPANATAAQAADAIAGAQGTGERGARSVDRFVMAVGILAALASIGTGLSSKLSVDADRHAQAAQGLSAALSGARRDWYNGKTPEDALRVIEKLDAEVLKNQ
jgi:hypothetical protein